MKNKTTTTPTTPSATVAAAAAVAAGATAELGHSPDALAQRRAELLALLAQAAPELMSDNQLDVARLQDLLGEDHLTRPEHYELNWAGKAAARREIQKTSSHTLRPDPSNPAQAAHMLIEGENLEVLRLLQKSYYGKVKMIYIDPPYNTGNDSFVYPDNYSETLDEYQRRTGEKNEAGFLNKQSLWKKNSKESGQYHSAWLSMMYPRLYLARNLLRDDGVIFISIDENEIENLIFLAKEIYGPENNIATLIWKNGRTAAAHFTLEHEYVVVFAKNKSKLNFFNFKGSALVTDRTIKKIGVKNPASEITFKAGVVFQGKDRIFPKKFGDSEKVEIIKGIFECKNGRLSNDVVIKAGWAMKDMIEAWIEGGEVFDQKGQRITSFFFKSNGVLQYEKSKATVHPKSIIEGFTTRTGTNDLEKILKKLVFDYPKPVNFIESLIDISTNENDLILDFFVGSGTTTQAVTELNLKDGGTRQSISVQMPEVLDEDSEAYKAGYLTIADITRARIDKVIAKLKAEQPDKTTDLACAHFTLAPSNFKVWRGDANTPEALREQLALFQTAEKMDSRIRGNDSGGSNVSGGGNDSGNGDVAAADHGAGTDKVDAQNAMLAELLLKHGLGALGVHAVSQPKQVAGVTVHRVRLPNHNGDSSSNADKTMWLCFDTYNPALKDEIVKAKPAQVVMLNSCFAGPKADELLSNLQLELAAFEIALTVI